VPGTHRGSIRGPRSCQGRRRDVDDGIDDGRDHALPVRDHGDAVAHEQVALAGPVEQQAVVPALGRPTTSAEVHVGHGGVVAVGQDEERLASAVLALRANGRNEQRRQQVPVERDRQCLPRWIAEGHGLPERTHLAVEGRSQAGIDGRTVERVVGDTRVRRRPQPMPARRGRVAGVHCLRRGVLVVRDRAHPGVVERPIVRRRIAARRRSAPGPGRGHGVGDGDDLPEVRPAGANEGQGPTGELVVERVGEELHTRTLPRPPRSADRSRPRRPMSCHGLRRRYVHSDPDITGVQV
jgi:hypothetical protein